MKFTATLFLLSLLVGCSPDVVQIGKVNMISNRNVESSAPYVLIRNYAGTESKDALKKSEELTIESAIDRVVRATPGGEFLKNVKLYRVRDRYFAVEGDVWGLEQNRMMRGFRPGHAVQWKADLKLRRKLENRSPLAQGVIVELKDDRVCTVKETTTGQVLELTYEELTRVEN